MEEVEQGQGPEHEQELNAKVLYDVSGGLSTHGRFAIGYGAVRAADVRVAMKENNVSQSNSVSMKVLAQQNAELRRENARLHKEKDSAMQQGNVAIDLTMVSMCIDSFFFLQANHFSKSEIFNVFTIGTLSTLRTGTGNSRGILTTCSSSSASNCEYN